MDLKRIFERTGQASSVWKEFDAYKLNYFSDRDLVALSLVLSAF